MSKKLPWFRAYTEMVDDEKLRLLAFEDRWHFVALLCLKGQGVLDESDALLFRKVAVKLGVDVRTLEEVARRLAEVGLIDEKTLQPLAWDSRQFKSDSSAERVAAYRERKKQAVKRDGNVTVTAQDTETDTEEETDKEKEGGQPAKAESTPSPSASQPSPAPADAAPPPPQILHPTPADPAPRTVKEPKVGTEPPPGVSADVWRDFVKHRNAKRAPITQTVVRLLTRELAKCAEAGLSPDDALSETMAAGWQAPKAEWLVKRLASAPAARPGRSSRETENARRKAEFLRMMGQHPDSNVIEMEPSHAIR